MDTWNEFFLSELHKKEIRDLIRKVQKDYKEDIVYPPHNLILNAFKKTSYNDVKVVIVGQDPYHNPKQGMGLSFSVNKDVKLPPSLINIFKEYQDDLNYPSPSSGDLTSWANNGVLLINSILTVKENRPLSCAYKEYEILFNDIIRFLNARKKKMVFILWGGPASKCEKFIDSSYHLVLKAPHPSPLSSYRGFFSSKPFSKANAFLKANNLEEVDWKLD